MYSRVRPFWRKIGTFYHIPENTEINGISDLDKIGLNPSLTDNAIAEIKKRVENGGKVNDLSTWLLWRKNITNSNFNYGLD